MNKKLLQLIIIIVIALLVIAGVFYYLWNQDHQKAVKLEAFATCIKNSGTLFYGAFWCPHCQDQKSMFETFFSSAVSNLPYVECSTPDTNGQLQVCIDKKITIYPTWKFSDGSTNEGEMTLQQLSAKTGCALPN